MPKRILLVTPTPSGRVDGNLVTVQRWAGILESLGHRVSIGRSYEGQAADCLVAVHAVKSHHAVAAFAMAQPSNPVVVCLSGTDIYGDLDKSPEALDSLLRATRLVALQPNALEAIPRQFRCKARVIYQSARPWKKTASPPAGHFRVIVIGHLRPEKDPFRVAEAARRLDSSSRVEVLHIGQALSEEMERRAHQESSSNPRYHWLGALSHREALNRLSASHLLAITSRMEGSSNVLSEALVAGVPVVASAIPGLIGTLGEDYPGLFPFGDTEALASLIGRLENEKQFYDRLKEATAALRPLLDPVHEKQAWRRLLEEIFGGENGSGPTD